LGSRGAIVAALLRRPSEGPWSSVVSAELGESLIAGDALAGVDTVFHLAGKAHTRARSDAEIRQYETVHVHGTRSLLQAARQAGVRCFVLLSSVKAMGEGDADVWDESTPCAPQNPYGVTKLSAERLVLQEFPVPCSVVLRPSLVYGPGSKGNLDLMIRAVRRRLFPAISFPPNSRSMIHVQDVVRACLLAATHPAACGQTFILTDGWEYSTRDILSWIFEVFGRRPWLKIPYGALRFAAVLGDVAERFGIAFPLTSDRLDKLAGSARYSNVKICRELGFAPSRDLRSGIVEMVAALERT
jgi:nucleoside-diphosphate-sugar epimerase